MDHSDDGRWFWASPGRAQDQFAHLLESGTLSDTQVRCGTRSWAVHKAILCVRSEWFKKALTGPFRESETGIIDLTDFDEDEVDCLLHYIYTGRVDILKHFPARAGITACVPIWKLGDFFCLDDLCELALRGRDDSFRRSASIFSAIGIDNLRTPETISTITQLVQTVYSEERIDIHNLFRPPLVAFLLSCIQCLWSEMEAFNKLLHEFPEFAADWAMALTNNMGSKKMPKRSSDKCKKCGALESKGFNFVKWIREHQPEFFCPDCFPLPRLEDWTGQNSKSMAKKA